MKKPLSSRCLMLLHFNESKTWYCAKCKKRYECLTETKTIKWEDLLSPEFYQDQIKRQEASPSP